MKPATVGNNLQQLPAIGRSEQQLQQSHISGAVLTLTPLLIYTSMSTRLGKKVTAALSCGSKLQRYLGGCNTLSVDNGSVSEQLVTLTLKATIQKLAERVSFRSSLSERAFFKQHAVLGEKQAGNRRTHSERELKFSSSSAGSVRENPPAAAMGAVYRERTGFHQNHGT